MKSLSQFETKTGEHSFVQSMTTTTDVNSAGESIQLVAYYGDSKDFERLTFEKLYSPIWVNVSLEKIKNNRRYHHSFSVNKAQLDQLIFNLQALSETIKEHPDTKIIAKQ